MNRLISFIAIIIAVAGANAQNYKGTLSKVKQDGLHIVLLQPEVRSASSSNLDYFRIIDDKKKEVSYTFLRPNPKRVVNYIPFAIISNKSMSDSITSVVVVNEKGMQLNNLVLTIANTSINKKYAISGSHGNEKWFGLVGNQIAYNLYDEKHRQVEKTFSFPLNNYKYLKFDFVDKKSLPINVLKIGLYENEVSAVTQLQLTNFEKRIVNDAKNKKTQIFISFKEPQIVNKIGFDITSDYYFRNADVLVSRTRKRKRHRTEKYQQAIESLQLSSAKSNNFEFLDIFEKEFVIEITNEDNQPLDIRNVSLFQEPLYVVANLKAESNYQVVIDSTLTKPNYDLGNLQLNDVKNHDLVRIDNFAKLNVKQSKNETEIKFWQTDVFMWVCIVFGVAIIGYFAMQLLKDMDKA